MSHGGRWSIVLLVLAVAGIVAIWPRSTADGPPSASAPPASGNPADAPSEEDPDLVGLRQRAALAPCPTRGAGTPKGPLAGVAARCLGQPGIVDVGAALAGRATLVNLWASWCGPCREEMPVLAAYAKSPGAIPVLGVDVQEPASAGLSFMAEVGVRYPSLHDGQPRVGPLRKALRTPPVLPVNYLVRPDGTVTRITDPLVFRDPDEVRRTVDRLLGATG